jgi:NifU-like protein involved in Fe-S cluster formation
MNNPVLLDHFLHPRCMGIMEGATHQALVRSGTCSDLVKMMARIAPDGTVEELCSQVYGCGYSIAGASLFNEMSAGRTADEVSRFTLESILGIAGEVPIKHHRCLALPIEAWAGIYRQYREGA